MPNIILVGFMGSGKTTIAMKLSHLLKMDYVSTDNLIEKKESATINEIFTKKGEDHFRAVESAVVLEHIAHLAAVTCQIAPAPTPVSQALLDRHYLRKHGPNAYYGQRPPRSQV